MKKLSLLMLLTIVLAGCGNSSKINALTLEEAQEIAVAEVGGKKILKAKQDYDDGITYYDFTVITDNEKYEIEVDANDGTILKKEKDDDYISNTNEGTVTPIDNSNTTTNTNSTTNNNNTTNSTNSTNNIISNEEAQNIALNKTGGGYLVKCELDNDDNMMVYEIEIKNGSYEYEVDINANTGEILKYEQDYND